MIRILSLIILVLVHTSAYPIGHGTVGVIGVVGVGSVSEVTPDIEINMDTSSADCGEVGWTGEFVTDPNDGVSCDATAHRVGSSGYSMLALGANQNGSYIDLGGAQTEMWFEFYWYSDDADSTWDTTNRYASITNAAGANDIFFHVRDSSGFKQGYNATGNQFGTVAAENPTQDVWIRIHVVKSATVGVVEIWESLNGVSYTKKVDASGIASTAGNDWDRLVLGYNQNNGLPNDWYFDSVKVYLTDPGW